MAAPRPASVQNRQVLIHVISAFTSVALSAFSQTLAHYAAANIHEYIAPTVYGTLVDCPYLHRCRRVTLCSLLHTDGTQDRRISNMDGHVAVLFDRSPLDANSKQS